MAVFYTILDHLRPGNSYGMSADPEPQATKETVIGEHGTTEFFLSVEGKDADKVWSIIGELMDALKVLNPKLYSRTIERLTAIE